MSYPEITEEVSTVRANICYFALHFFEFFRFLSVVVICNFQNYVFYYDEIS